MSRRPRPQTAREIREKEERRRWWSGITRDVVICAIGVALLVNEAFFHHGPPRDSLLVIYGGMIGSPLIIRADQARRNNGKGK